LLIWGGLAFLAIPFIMMARNIRCGFIRGFGDLKLAWHASMLPLDEVEQRHVWLLSDTIEMPDGSVQVVHHARAPRITPSSDALAAQVHRLRELGVERVWVSFKMPLLVFLFPAVLPLVLLGDPTALFLAWMM